MYNKDINTLTQLSRKKDQIISQLVSLLEENDQSDLIGSVNIEQMLLDVSTVSTKHTSKPKSTLKTKSDQLPAPSSNLNIAAFF